jgi:hypothetical protein
MTLIVVVFGGFGACRLDRLPNAFFVEQALSFPTLEALPDAGQPPLVTAPCLGLNLGPCSCTVPDQPY